MKCSLIPTTNTPIHFDKNSIQMCYFKLRKWFIQKDRSSSFYQVHQVGSTRFLTILDMGLFSSFRHKLYSSNIKDFLVHFLGQGHRGYPCDQVEVKNGPNKRLLTELWSFKVGRGGSWSPPPCQVWLKGGVFQKISFAKKIVLTT